MNKSISRSRPFLYAFASQNPNRLQNRRQISIVCRNQQWNSSFASSGSTQLRITSKRILKQLSSLKLAIAELAAIAALSSIGTVIKQNESSEYYLQTYPGLWGDEQLIQYYCLFLGLPFPSSPAFKSLLLIWSLLNGMQKGGGLFDYRLIWALQWDHIYTASYFVLLLALLAASLAACTTTRQWPMVRVARRWRLAGTVDRLAGMGTPENTLTLPDARVQDFGQLLRGKGYSVFLKQDSMYAFKGMAGRFAPIGVHASMLLVMFGITLGAFGGSIGSAMVPEDGDFILAEALQPKSFLARPAKELSTAKLHVDDFRIEFRDDGSVGQYRSTLTLSDEQTKRTIQNKVISVNDPLRYKGLTAYQTDWSIAALSLNIRSLSQADQPVQSLKLPVASLEGQPGIEGKLWATFLPATLGSDPGANPRGISLVMRDVQTVALYDSQGAFVGIRRPESGKPITVEGLELTVTGLIGSTGLELKVDPGIPYVYAGFGGMMLTTALSYLSHSQVWALQQGNLLHISGKTNRAKNEFQQELAVLTELVPEHAPGR